MLETILQAVLWVILAGVYVGLGALVVLTVKEQWWDFRK